MSLPKAPNEWCGVHTLLSRRKRAVSELIAALFLIMIAVTVGTAIYLYVIGRSYSTLSSLILWSAETQSKLMEDIVVVAATYNNSLNEVQVLVYNSGRVPVKIVSIYAGLTPYNASPALLSATVLVLPEDFAIVNTTLPFTPPRGSIIYVTLVTERGQRIEARISA